MDQMELRLKVIEIAAKHPHSGHTGGYAAGVLDTVKVWEAYVRKPSPSSKPKA